MGKSFDIQQTTASSHAVVMLRTCAAQGEFDYAVVHILKFDNGKIVVMWDIGQDVPSDSPNGLGMFQPQAREPLALIDHRRPFTGR